MSCRRPGSIGDQRPRRDDTCQCKSSLVDTHSRRRCKTAWIYEWRAARIQRAMLDMLAARGFGIWCALDPENLLLHTGLSHCDRCVQKVTVTLAEVSVKQDDDVKAGRLGRKALRQLRLSEDHKSGKRKLVTDQVEVSLY